MCAATGSSSYNEPNPQGRNLFLLLVSHSSLCVTTSSSAGSKILIVWTPQSYIHITMSPSRFGAKTSPTSGHNNLLSLSRKKEPLPSGRHSLIIFTLDSALLALQPISLLLIRESRLCATTSPSFHSESLLWAPQPDIFLTMSAKRTLHLTNPV